MNHWYDVIAAASHFGGIIITREKALRLCKGAQQTRLVYGHEEAIKYLEAQLSGLRHKYSHSR